MRNLFIPRTCTHEIVFNLSEVGRIQNDCVLDSAYLIGATRFILNESLTLCAYLPHIPDTFTKFFSKHELAEAKETNFVRINNDHSNLSFRTSISTKKPLLGNTISCLHPNHNNFYHFCVEALYDLILALDRNITIDNILVDHQLNKNMLHIIRSLCPKATIFRLKSGNMINAKKVILFKEHNFQGMWLKDGSCDPLHFLNAQWLLRANSILSDLFRTAPRKSKFLCFFQRKSGHRITLNEKSLQHAVKKHCNGDTKSLRPENSLKRTVMALKGSKILVAQSGASLANLLFVQNKLTVILWERRGNNDQNLNDFLKILGHQYKVVGATTVIRTHAFHPDILSLTQADLVADISSILKEIQPHNLSSEL
jgi:hypothetical protein